MARVSGTIGVVLAGGRSSRMGRDKALLPFQGHGNFLERARSLLAALPLARVVVSGARPGAIPDLVPDKGPLGGLHALADTAEAALVIPVDMPLLHTELLQTLLHCGETSGRACYFDHFFFPLWLPFNTHCRTYLQRAVDGSAGSAVGSLLRHLRAHSISQTPEGAWQRNINTPAEYRALPEANISPTLSFSRET